MWLLLFSSLLFSSLLFSSLLFSSLLFSRSISSPPLVFLLQDNSHWQFPWQQIEISLHTSCGCISPPVHRRQRPPLVSQTVCTMLLCSNLHFSQPKKPSSTMSLSLSSKLQPTSFFKASRWPRGHECHIESRSLVLISLSLGGRFGIMGGLRWVPCMEFSELRMMSVIAQSGWGCATCPWRCVCVCVCHGWLGTCSLMCSVLLQFNRFCINSLLSLCQSITSIHSGMLLFLFIHFFLLHSFTILSLPLIPVELSLDCYSALSSIVLLIYLSLFSLCDPLPLSYLALFVSHSPAELPDWSNIYS